jgi:hypothetical protein
MVRQSNGRDWHKIESESRTRSGFQMVTYNLFEKETIKIADLKQTDNFVAVVGDKMKIV